MSHRLFVGTDEGDIHVYDTALVFDPLRAGDASGDPMAIQPSYSLGSVGAPIAGLFVPPSGNELIVTTADDEVLILDASSGEVLGRVTLPGVSDVVEAGSGDQVIADPVRDRRRPGRRSLLAEMLGGDAAEIEARLAERAGRVIVAPAPSASERTTLDEAIADGRLAGRDRRVGAARRRDRRRRRDVPLVARRLGRVGDRDRGRDGRCIRDRPRGPDASTSRPATQVAVVELPDEGPRARTSTPRSTRRARSRT